MRSIRYITCLLPLVLGACSTLGGNISGSWRCDAPEGQSCAFIDEIDRPASGRAKGEPLNLMPTGPITEQPLADLPHLPSRSGDVIARVVFPAFVDSHGVLHGRSESFAVMQSSAWTDGAADLAAGKKGGR